MPARPIRHRLQRALTCVGAAAVLALFGAAVLPWAESLHQRELADGLSYPAPKVDKKDALSQQLSFFTLGGLRTLAAEVLAMDATAAWLENDWPRARKRWESITTLCPRRINYWARAARDMSKNAVAATNARRDLDAHERAVMSRDYLDTAESFLQRGIANNPQSALLRLELAAYYEDLARRPQFAKAAEAYRDAVAHGASPMYRRWEFYNLCRIRGREKEAWELGRRLFNEERHRSPSLRCLLFVLQASLPDIPAAERLTPTQLFKDEAAARRQLNMFRRNDLRFPTRGIDAYLATPPDTL